MKKKFLIIAFSGLLLAACGGEEDTSTEDITVEEITTEEVCTYSYNPNETELTWTAFKLTERIGVSGTFNEINVTANDGSEDMFGALIGATFNIPVSGTNSQHDERDPKIINNFFGAMLETTEITGSIISLNENSGSVEIKMNGISFEYPGEISVDGEEITFLTMIDLVDFNAEMAVDSLGVVCEAKHTGADGINKLWTEVEIAVKTTLTKTCK